jgi:hypothetical protein
MARFATRVTGDDDALECPSVAYSFITVSLRNIVLASLARQRRSRLAVLCGCAQVDVGLRPQPRQLREGAVPNGASTGTFFCSMPPFPFTPRFHFLSASVPELLLCLIDLGASRDLSGGISRSIDAVWLCDMFAVRRGRFLTIRGGFGTRRESTLKLGGTGGSWRRRQRHGVRLV